MINEIEAKGALAMLEAGTAIMIDVREKSEFADGHIPYAMSIPMGAIDHALHYMKFPADKAIIFQCHVGGRSGRVCLYAQGLHNLGNEILNLKGGIDAWEDAGLIII